MPKTFILPPLYNKKLFVFSFLFTLISSVFGYAENIDLKSAKKILVEAKRVVSGDKGESPADYIPEEIRAFNFIYNSSQPNQLFKDIYQESKTAGKFYAIMGLYLLKDSEFEKYKENFSANHSKVDFVYGCEVISDRDMSSELDLWLKGKMTDYHKLIVH